MVATVICTGTSIAVGAPDLLDEPDRSCDRGRRVVAQAEGEGQVEEHLGVRGALDVGEQVGVDRHRQVPLDLVEADERAVVHPQPVAVAEGVAVGLLHGRAGGGPDVREDPPRVAWADSSRRLRSFQAGSVLRNRPGVS